MPLMTNHDCEKEYWRQCLHCVAGDPDATFECLELDALGVCLEVKITYPDGSETFLVRDVNGWRFPENYRTDCATATGMYDPEGRL